MFAGFLTSVSDDYGKGEEMKLQMNKFHNHLSFRN